MDLKPFISNANTWRKHFEDSTKTKHNKHNKFHVIQEGSGFPLNNVVSISPTKQAQEIAKSQLIEINKSATPVKRKYIRRGKQKPAQSKSNIRRGKVKSQTKHKKKILSHKKKK